MMKLWEEVKELEEGQGRLFAMNGDAERRVETQGATIADLEGKLDMTERLNTILLSDARTIGDDNVDLRAENIKLKDHMYALQSDLEYLEGVANELMRNVRDIRREHDEFVTAFETEEAEKAIEVPIEDEEIKGREAA